MRQLLCGTTLLLFVLPLGLNAAIHEVAVGDNFFEPNDLTIEAGDTVRWTYNGSRLHDVTADDFSWASPTSSSFTYEQTFSSLGEVLYHCTVHSSPGRNIQTSMNGRLNVVQSTPQFSINSAVSDAWFNPATNGQGFFVIVWENIEVVFLSWFTYDTERPADDVKAILGEPGHRWITAQGPYSGDTALLEAFSTRGGVFDSVNPPVEQPQPIGSISITWVGCNEGLLSYDLPNLGLMGDVPIQRIVLDNVPACEAGQASE